MRAGRKLAKVPSAVRRPRMACSGRTAARGASPCEKAALPVDVADGVEDAVGGAAAVVGYLDQVVVSDFLLVVRQVLEAGEGMVELFLGQQEPERFETCPQRLTSRVPAQTQRRGLGANRSSRDDLVGVGIFEHVFLA